MALKLTFEKHLRMIFEKIFEKCSRLPVSHSIFVMTLSSALRNCVLSFDILAAHATASDLLANSTNTKPLALPVPPAGSRNRGMLRNHGSRLSESWPMYV